MEVDFAKFLALLQLHQVDYILVGGLAVAINGYQRSTEDVDIIIPRNAENQKRLIAALQTFGAGHGGQMTLADFTDDPGALRVIEDFPVDIFIQMAGRHYEDLIPHSKIHRETGVEVRYLDINGLLLLKKDSFREKDQHDLIVLRDLLKKERK